MIEENDSEKDVNEDTSGEPNRDTDNIEKEQNDEEKYKDSPFLNKNKGGLSKGRFDFMTPEKRIEMARLGGSATSEKKRLSSRLNPITTGRYSGIPNCDDCEKKDTCILYREGLACQVELNIKRNAVRAFSAIAGGTPEDMLVEMYRVYEKIVDIIEEDPSYTKYQNLMYMLMNIYRLKFGEALFIKSFNIDISNNPTLDIKNLMAVVRKKQQQKQQQEEDEEKKQEEEEDKMQKAIDAQDKDKGDPVP